MIEDALKSTRNLHRLIIGISLAVLVFSLSMSSVEEKNRQKTAIDELIEFDFLAYKTWLDSFVDAEVKKRVQPATKPLREFIDKSSHLIFGLDTITEVMEKPAHIGQFLISDSILGGVSATNLTSLAALNGLSLAQDVQITVPQVDGLIAQLETFLNENGGTGKRITDAMNSIGDDSQILTTFLPDAASLANLYFELIDTSVASATPVFQGLYKFDLITIPNSSFISWLNQQRPSPLVTTVNDELRFLPDLEPFPKGYAEETLGTLSLRLEDEIRSAGPDQRAIKILGTEVPGRLLVLAAPLILLALLYYFKSHLSHINRMAATHGEEMIGFSWLPINANVWQIPGTNISGSGYIAEIVGTLALLPIGALLVLYFRLGFFGSVHWGTMCLIASTCMFAVLICWMSLRDVRSIRARLCINSELNRSDIAPAAK